MFSLQVNPPTLRLALASRGLSSLPQRAASLRSCSVRLQPYQKLGFPFCILFFYCFLFSLHPSLIQLSAPIPSSPLLSVSLFSPPQSSPSFYDHKFLNSSFSVSPTASSLLNTIGTVRTARTGWVTEATCRLCLPFLYALHVFFDHLICRSFCFFHSFVSQFLFLLSFFLHNFLTIV